MGYLYKHPWVIIPFAIFLSGILYYLWPDLPSGLNIAVAIYSSCIVAMALLSINTKPHLLPTAFIMLLIGALSFVFSDTVIALNKFKTAQLSISHARLIIMFFYLLGQGLIVGGLVVNSTSSSHISSDYQQS